MSIKKILVPVDYSDCSNFASRYAIKLACRLGAEVVLIHVYYTPSFDLIELSGTVQIQTQLKDEVSVNIEATEKSTLESFIEEVRVLAGDCDLKIGYELVSGVPQDEIIRFINTYHPDIVIMGTRGKDKASSILGSVTESIIRKISYPVLAIPENYTFIGEKNIKNLMYVTEFDESDFVSIKKLMDLIKPLDLTIFCVHIGEETGEWDRIKMEGLKEYFRHSYGKREVTCDIIHSKNPIEELNKLAQDRMINIVTVTSRRRRILDKLFKTDLTKKLFYHTNIPLLVFHA